MSNVKELPKNIKNLFEITGSITTIKKREITNEEINVLLDEIENLIHSKGFIFPYHGKLKNNEESSITKTTKFKTAEEVIGHIEKENIIPDNVLSHNNKGN